MKKGSRRTPISFYVLRFTFYEIVNVVEPAGAPFNRMSTR